MTTSHHHAHVVRPSKGTGYYGQLIGAHAILICYTMVALFPVLLIVINSFKSRREIFGQPLKPALPGGLGSEAGATNWLLSGSFDTVGYETVIQRGNFDIYFRNSIVVTLGALFLILLTGTMASFALSEYKFRGNTLMGLYLAIGIMVPIRLGTVSLLRLMKTLELVDTLWALILVYTAQGLPLAVFIMTEFMRAVPRDLKDAARVDGASEYRIYGMILPLVRPALGTVAVFNMIPIWNDLWFPLVMAQGENVKTVTLGANQFLGQFESDWNAVLASLSLSMVPVVILYIIFSRQLIRGLTSGAVK